MVYGVNEGGLDGSQGSLVLYKKLIGVQGLNRVFDFVDGSVEGDHGGVTGCQTIGIAVLTKKTIENVKCFLPLPSWW